MSEGAAAPDRKFARPVVFPRRALFRLWPRICAVLVLLSFGGSKLLATTYQWNGGGGNVNWSTALNWTGGAPASATTTDLTSAGTTNLGTVGIPLNQNIATPFTLNSISFSAGAGAFSLGGGALQFDGAGNTITQNATNAQTIANAISNPNNKPTTLTLTGSGAGLVTLSGIISIGSGGRDYALVKSGTSTFALTGTNTYAGGTTIDGGTIQINSASSLGAAGGALTLNAGTLEVSAIITAARNITLGSTTSTIRVDAGQTYTNSGVLSGLTGALTKTDTGTLVLSGANTFGGGTNINGGILQAGSSGALGSSGTISFGGGTLQYSSSNTTDYTARFSNLAGQAYSIDTNGQSVILASTALTSVSGTLTKSGTGTLTLRAANTLTGATTVTAGTLSLDNAGSSTARLAGSYIKVNSGGTLLLSSSSGASNDRINNSTTMTLNGGTFSTGGLSEHGASNNTAGIGALTLQATSIIDMGSGASIVAFANSLSAAWTGTLNIYNWTGTARTGGGTDQLFFGNDSTGLTAAQLLNVQFYSGSGTGAYGPGAMILANGEVVAIPEARTFLPGLLAALIICLRLRFVRRFIARSRQKPWSPSSEIDIVQSPNTLRILGHGRRRHSTISGIPASLPRIAPARSGS